MKRLILVAAILAISPAAGQDRQPARDLPNPSLTPGAIASSMPVCGSTRELRHWSRARDNAILREYGLPAGPHPDFEVDHLVPLALGGSDDDANLWAEPRASIEPDWNAERKDKLEWKLRDLACAGQLDVPEIQREIAADWIRLYQHVFRK